MFIIFVVLNNFIMEYFKTNLGFEFSIEIVSNDLNNGSKDITVSTNYMTCDLRTSAQSLEAIALDVQTLVNSSEIGFLTINVAKVLLPKGITFKLQVSENSIDLICDYIKYTGHESIRNFINNQ